MMTKKIVKRDNSVDKFKEKLNKFILDLTSH